MVGQPKPALAHMPTAAQESITVSRVAVSTHYKHNAADAVLTSRMGPPITVLVALSAKAQALFNHITEHHGANGQCKVLYGNIMFRDENVKAKFGRHIIPPLHSAIPPL
jgi:hypothetical protein